ncbi:MAG: hypothetical protein AAFV85_23055 [Cyanobacteria bacterium J06634_6]
MADNLATGLKCHISWQVSQMAEIRATGVSDKTWQRWKEISELFGDDTNAKTMATVINLVHTLYCSSRWADIQRKAATLVTAQWANRDQEIVPMHPSEVKRVSMDEGKVLVYTHSRGEPYPIKRDVWEQS